MFLKVDNSKNQPNMKTRLKVSTKYILGNALNKKKTNMLIYLVNLFKTTISIRTMPF